MLENGNVMLQNLLKLPTFPKVELKKQFLMQGRNGWGIIYLSFTIL